MSFTEEEIAYLRSTAELVERDGQFGRAPYMRITPTVSWSWNLEARSFGPDDEHEFAPRRTVHESRA